MLDAALLAGSLSVEYASNGRRSAALREADKLAQLGDYVLAAKAVEPALRSGSASLSTIGHYALGTVLERGLVQLPIALAQLLELLVQLPERTAADPDVREMHAKRLDAMLSGLFRTLVAQCQFHMSQRTETWTTWLADMTIESVQTTATISRKLRDRLGELVEEPLSLRPLTRIEALVAQDVAGAIAKRKPASTDTPTEVMASSEQPIPARDVATAQSPATPSTTASDMAISDAEPMSGPPLAQAAHPKEDSMNAPRGSTIMRTLLRKLQAFQDLVATGDMVKAAIVTKDIEQIRAAFDPVIYLPELFGPYLQTLCTHGDDLAQHAETDHSLSLQAMEQLYHADIDAFIAQS